MTTTTLAQKALIDAANVFLEKDKISKEATSAQGKAKTALKNAFLEYRKQNNLNPATTIQIDERVYTYSAAIADKVNSRGWHEMWKRGEITEDQYFSAIDVSLTTARTLIGEDQALLITETVVGKTFDMRVTKAEEPHKFKINVPVESKPVARLKKAPILEAAAATAPRTRQIRLRTTK